MAASTASRPFNRHVLIWARERLGLDQSTAATFAKVDLDRLAEWETGGRQPTMKEGRKLAATYNRPFLEFFAREAPNVPGVQLVPDYRLYSDPPSKMEKALLTETQRWAEEQRLNALDLFEMLGEDPPKFPSSLYEGVDSDVEEAAKKARSAINFPIEEQIGIKSSKKHELPKMLRHKLERMGVLVLKKSGLTKLRVRGMCLYAQTLPTIVYSNEIPGAQAFTITHELGHIVLKNSAISGDPVSKTPKSSGQKRVEEWCNRFAASFLAPRDSIEGYLGKPRSAATYISDEDLHRIASIYAVSSHAMIVRLVNLGYVSSDFYWNKKRKEIIDAENNAKQFGRSEYWAVRFVNSNGDLYTSLVLDAWRNGLITNHNAAEFMGINNLAHFNAIQEKFGR